MSNTILVTGATGTVGRELVKALTVAGADVIAMSSTGKVVEGVESRVADLADPASLAGAFRGIDTLFLLLPLQANMVELAGVGRKTANVVLGVAYEIPSGVVVDTHVTRLSNRLGFVKGENAVKIERELIPLLPESDWIDYSHLLITHGRKICKARKPQCQVCFLDDLCPKIGVSKS